MRKPNTILIAATGLALAALACGPTSGAPDPAAVTATFGALLTQAAKTAVAGGAPVAEVTEAPAEAPIEEPTEAPAVENTLPPDVTATNTAIPQPTEPGVPFVTANVNANVRKGSSTSHEVVGALLAGQTANIEGRNVSGTWYLIAFLPAPGGKGWIAASVVSVSGDQSNIPVVADPPTPTHTPTNTFTPTATLTPTATFTATGTATATASPTTPAAQADLVVSSAVSASGTNTVIYIVPKPANPTTTWTFNVRVKNIGTAGAVNSFVKGSVQGSLVVLCLAPPNDSKNVAPLAPAEESVVVPVTVDTVGYGSFTLEFKADFCSVIDESNEGNNTLTVQVNVS